MNENLEKLIKLMKENPEMPVVPMVYMEASGGDCGYFVGRINDVEIGEAFSTDYTVDAIFKKSDNFYQKYDTVEYLLGDEAVMDMGYLEIEEYYNNLSWRKCILVDIDRA